MEAHARRPDPLIEGPNMAKNWRIWREDFIIFMKVTKFYKKPNDETANILKNLIGKVGIEAINNLSFERPQDKGNVNILITKLENYFDPPKKEIEERYKFFTKSRKRHESIENYVNDLKEQAKTCNFGTLTDSLIRDQIISDTKEENLRKRYFDEENLNLEKLIAICKEYELTTAKINQDRSCWRCGTRHPPRNCPDWGKKCPKCGILNHTYRCQKYPINNNQPHKKYDNNIVKKNMMASFQQPDKSIKNNCMLNENMKNIDQMVSMDKSVPPTNHMDLNIKYDDQTSKENTSYTKNVWSVATAPPQNMSYMEKGNRGGTQHYN